MRRHTLLLSLTVLACLPAVWTVQCYDCVGRDCMGKFCEGDYCVLSQFAPRWGSIEYGKPKVVKGCMSGNLLRKDIRSHCEVSEDDDEDVFTCYCKGKDNCNGGRALRRLEPEPVKLVRCQCTGEHCDGKTCLGELCSYVLNHKTEEVERGCVNASVPLVERRSMGSCMSPPITGAMHHSVAMKADDLLFTESCVCGTDFCNSDKPEIKILEKMTCSAGVMANIKGTKMKSANTTCTGEFCFKVEIKSKLGYMKDYWAVGCASFTGEDELAEELNPTGCAEFQSEQLFVSACYRTDDPDAKGRARAQQRIVSPSRKGKGRGKKPSRREEEEEEVEEEEEAEDEEPPRKEKVRPKEKEDEEEKEEEETKKEEKNEQKEEKEEEEETTPRPFLFEEPTEPPIPDESNATMITVFILIMLCIVVSGAVWKFELHKKLFRSSYDTVAGG